MIWVVGNKGMLGTELSLLLENEGLPFLGTDRELSILNPEELRLFADGRNIRWIINCAAYTAVDKAEDEPDLCRALNAEGPQNLGKLASGINASVIHISTDYVFGGAGIQGADGILRPYREEDPIDPKGVYGRTKAEGEKSLLSACSRSIILRTSWLYGKYGPNFVQTMLRLMKEREKIGVVSDQKGTPTWAYDLAGTILKIIKTEKPVYGIFHYSNEGQTSWYDFAGEIYKLVSEYGILDNPCTLEPLRTEQYPTKAARPAYSVLSKEKIKKEYRLSIPDWQKSLSKYLFSLAENILKK